MRFKYLLFTLTLVVFSCKNKENEKIVTTSVVHKPVFDFSDGDYFRKGYTKEEERFKLVPASESPKFEDASIDGFSWEDGKARFDISNYELGAQTPDAASKSCANSEKGQHIHFIVDKKDYIAKYESEFDVEIPDGQHYILAFLSRSYHESIKEPKAAYYKFIEVVDGKIEYEWDLTDPTLFYSRPKGTYIGEDAKRVLLDFYPLNVTIGKDAWVEVYINGEYKILDKWQPYFIEGLPYGVNTVALKLVDSKGEPLPFKQVAILKEIQLERDPSENL